MVGSHVLAGDLLDYVWFCAAYTYWRSRVCLLGCGIVDPCRWKILPEGHGVQLADGKKRFFNLSMGVFVRVLHPFLSGLHRVLDSVDGLLLMQADHEDNDVV
jgi:hypothetical protein